MTEDELRALVREIVANRLAARPSGRAEALPHLVSRQAAPVPLLIEPSSHSSHGMLRMAPTVQKGQPCIIEPQVACGLCGFCQSLGH